MEQHKQTKYRIALRKTINDQYTTEVERTQASELLQSLGVGACDEHTIKRFLYPGLYKRQD